MEKNKNVKHFRTQTDGETDGKDREREEQINIQTDRPHDHKGSSELSIQVS